MIGRRTEKKKRKLERWNTNSNVLLIKNNHNFAIMFLKSIILSVITIIMKGGIQTQMYYLKKNNHNFAIMFLKSIILSVITIVIMKDGIQTQMYYLTKITIISLLWI